MENIFYLFELLHVIHQIHKCLKWSKYSVNAIVLIFYFKQPSFSQTNHEKISCFQCTDIKTKD